MEDAVQNTGCPDAKSGNLLLLLVVEPPSHSLIKSGLAESAQMFFGVSITFSMSFFEMKRESSPSNVRK